MRLMWSTWSQNFFIARFYSYIIVLLSLCIFCFRCFCCCWVGFEQCEKVVKWKINPKCCTVGRLTLFFVCICARVCVCMYVCLLYRHVVVFWKCNVLCLRIILVMRYYKFFQMEIVQVSPHLTNCTFPAILT